MLDNILSSHQTATLDMLETSSSQSEDGSRNPATLKISLFAIEVNEKAKNRSLLSKSTYFRCGKVPGSDLKYQ